MNLPQFIALRLIKSKRSKKSNLSGPLYRISILAIALSIGVMIISVAVLNGFQDEITNKVIGFGAHIQLSNYDNNNSLEPQPIDFDAKQIAAIRSIDGIKTVSPYGLKAGIVKTDTEMEGVVLKGINKNYDTQFFEKHLTQGKLFSLKDTVKSDSILISSKIAATLNFKVNDKVVIYFIQNPARVRKFVISGIYSTGLEDFDSKYILCDVRHIQKLNNWDSTQYAGVDIAIQNFKQLDYLTEEVNAAIPPDLLASNIKEQFPQLFDWLKLQDINVQVIIILMTLVAIVNMITALIILILENTRLIGILKALGMNNFNLRKVFLYQAGALIGKGLLWGNLCALTLCALQYYFHFVTLDESSYYMAFVPIKLLPLHWVLINVGTLFICTLALLIPSGLVAKISPVKAIRYS